METALKPEQGLVLAPVSPAIAKLLHQLQAQIIREANERAQALAGEVVLPPASGWRVFDHAGSADTDNVAWYSDTTASSMRMIRRRVKPEGWGDEISWHPSYFAVHIRREDTEGRMWEHYAGDHVTDDFGALVAVPRELQ